MASKTIVTLEDDLDGGLADETLTFGLDGRQYEIDLSEKNAAKLRKALARYVAAGRRGGRIPNQRRSTGGSDGNAAVIREWAKASGYEVSDRGRISFEIREAYVAAS
jgi:hypothetical protein